MCIVLVFLLYLIIYVLYFEFWWFVYCMCRNVCCWSCSISCDCICVLYSCMLSNCSAYIMLYLNVCPMWLFCSCITMCLQKAVYYLIITVYVCSLSVTWTFDGSILVDLYPRYLDICRQYAGWCVSQILVCYLHWWLLIICWCSIWLSIVDLCDMM